MCRRKHFHLHKGHWNHRLIDPCSTYAKEIDGHTLTLRDSQIGVFPGSPAVKFYTVPSADGPGRVELHKYPVSDSDRVLAFVGKQGLLDFAVADPAAVTPGTTCDWKSFGLGKERPGKPGNLVTYTSSKGGSWVAFKNGNDGWTINWRAGTFVWWAPYARDTPC